MTGGVYRGGNILIHRNQEASPLSTGLNHLVAQVPLSNPQAYDFAFRGGR